MKKLLFILLLIPSLLFAQKKHSVEKADAAFNSEKYSDATELYKDAYTHLDDKKNKKAMKAKEIKSLKAEILFKIGECYRMMNDCKQEEQWYQKAIKANCPDTSTVRGYLYEAQKCMAKYDSISRTRVLPTMSSGTSVVYSTNFSRDSVAPPAKRSGVRIIAHDTADSIKSFHIGKPNATIAGKGDGPITKDALIAAGEIRITGRKDLKITGFTMHVNYKTTCDTTKQDKWRLKSPPELNATDAKLTSDMIKAIKNCQPAGCREAFIIFDNIKYLNGSSEDTLNSIGLILEQNKEGK
jgi:hypothetical protein